MISEIFLDTDPSLKRYLNLLYIITNVSNQNKDLANYFVAKGLYSKLGEKLKSTFYQYKKTNDLRS